MKVLHFVDIMNRAGQETLIMNIFRTIDRNNIQFGFLCTNPNKGDYDDEVVKLNGKIFHVTVNRIKGKLRHFDNFIILCKTLKGYTKDYDVFHIHTHHAFDALISAGAAYIAGFKKIVVHSHSSFAEAHILLHKFSKMPLNLLPITKLCCSSSAGEWMFTNHDYTVINNAIDLQKFKFNNQLRRDIRHEYNLENNYVIGNVARFAKSKNHSFLIEVFNQYLKYDKTAKLILVGTGAEEKSIKYKCDKLGISDCVLFLGNRNDVHKLLQAMDLFVFPSLYEGLGIVVIEAQSSDLPCLVSDNMPMEVNITKQLFRCPLSASADEWAKLMLNIKAKGFDKIRVDNTVLLQSENYSIQTIAKELAEIYQKQ